jgi:putative drug exporter of the RND superfamily
MSRFLYRLGRAMVARRRLVLASWVAAVALLVILGSTVGGRFTDDFSLADAESTQALELLRERFPEQAGGTAQLVFATERGTLREGPAAEAMAEVLEEVRRMPGVVSAGDPATFDDGAVSEEGTIAFASVAYAEDAVSVGQAGLERLDETVHEVAGDRVRVEIGGELPQAVEQPHTGTAEMAGVAAAVVILLIAFGSVIAMGLPIGLAIFGLVGGISGLGLLAAFVDVPSVAPLLSTMIGLGVGIDYALFVVTRHRRHLHEGMTVEESAGRAIATAGQAVVFAGGTVVIAIGGLALAGIPAVTMMGLATALVVVVMVIGSITLVPALLGFAGHAVDRLQVPGIEPFAEADDTGLWGRWGRRVSARPIVYLVVGTAFLLTLAAPVLTMRLGQFDAGTLPTSSSQRQAYDLVAEGFGAGFNGPLLVTVELPAGAAEDQAALASLAESLQADPTVAVVAPPTVNEAGDTAVVAVIPATAPQDPETSELVHRLRDEVIPAAVAGTEASGYVGGITPTFMDISERVAERLPLFIGAVIALSFVLLTMVFRAPLVALKAAVLNLLSIGAAYGAVVAVFQWGWGLELFGLESTVPIVSFVPMIMFAILFGLSMDYEVFLLSRVREEHLLGKDTTASVVAGIASTARVITSAALIMICVFLGFVASAEPVVKMMGLGLAVAIFVDATIVRIVLVPATMSLLGETNWWMPRWLDRLLPNLDIEGESGLPEPEYTDGADRSPRVAELVGSEA